MSAADSALLLLAGLIGALLLFSLELTLSVALVAASALSRVALQRLSVENGDRLGFVVDLKTPRSTYRSATHIVRQLSLLGGCVLLGLMAYAAGWLYPWIVGLVTGALLGVLFLEGLVARSLALRDPRAALRITARVVRPVHAIMYPLVAPLNRVLSRASVAPRTREESREEEDEEVDALIEVGEREGILEGEEGKMMRGIADLDETRVREIMTPRTDIVSLPVETSVAQARRALIEEAHSRIPVYSGTIDNVVGVLHARDLFRAWQQGKEGSGIQEYLRPALFVPETLSLADLLRDLRLRTQIAMVVDEYGGIAGLVSLEDVLEEIVGEIRDEHDLEETQVVKEEEDGTWLVSGLAPVKQLETLFDIHIGERDFDTVAGLVVAGFGRVPREGEILTAYGLSFEILQADPKRVYRVRIQRAQRSGEAQASP